jgi:hypothetical protein
MRVPFYCGAIIFGGPSLANQRDASVTFCLGRRRDNPPDELSWNRIWRWAWDWFPDIALRASDLAVTADGSLVCGWWSGRLEPAFRWHWSYEFYHTTWRSKMHVYLTGSKERANPRHNLFVCPASEPGKMVTANDIPAEWKEPNGEPKTFAIVFANGRAEVDQKLGEWLIATKQAQRTKLMRASGSMLGTLAGAIAGR